jgi:hypothetical protein
MTIIIIQTLSSLFYPEQAGVRILFLAWSTVLMQHLEGSTISTTIGNLSSSHYFRKRKFNCFLTAWLRRWKRKRLKVFTQWYNVTFQKAVPFGVTSARTSDLALFAWGPVIPFDLFQVSRIRLYSLISFWNCVLVRLLEQSKDLYLCLFLVISFLSFLRCVTFTYLYLWLAIKEQHARILVFSWTAFLRFQTKASSARDM